MYKTPNKVCMHVCMYALGSQVGVVVISTTPLSPPPPSPSGMTRSFGQSYIHS